MLKHFILPEIVSKLQGKVLCFSVWLGFATWTITFWAKRKTSVKPRCTLAMLSNYTFENAGAKSVVMKTSCNEKMKVTTMLAVLAVSSMFSNMILKCKTMPREITVTSQLYGWVTNTLMKNWLAVAWNRSPGILLRKWRMFHLGCI